jgi:filamentous hemagglutinin
MQNRGVPPSVVENTIENGVPIRTNRPNTMGFHDPQNKITVITNSKNGRIVTVIRGGR